MTRAVFVGAGIGLGLALLLRGLWPARPTLAASLAHLHSGRLPLAPTAILAPTQPATWRGGIGRSVTAALHDLGIELGSHRQDLRVMERSLEAHVAEKVLFALGGATLAAATAGVVRLAGIQLPFLIPAWALIVVGSLGWFAPDLVLRSEAETRQRSFRHAVGAFLDLVAVSLAGGTGIEGALHGAVTLGQGWGFTRLSEALEHARLAGDTPWAALGRVGEELGVPELRELAASLVLAGHEGAKVRQSLAAKAASVRLHQLADVEGEAAEATERMVLPIGLLFFGFLVFIGYPAVAAIVGGF
jgi:Flp pilus assembly protein TadB